MTLDFPALYGEYGGKIKAGNKPERNRRMFLSRHMDKKNYSEIGRENGLSRVCTRQAIQRIERDLKKQAGIPLTNG